MINVLALDGGGVRGVIAARFLKEIELRTNKTISDLFSLTVGTSTGGILALATNLVAEDGHPKFKASDLVDLYSDKCYQIFTCSSIYRVESLGGVLMPKYERASLDQLLEDYFGETKLSESKNSVCVTSYSLTKTQPALWCSYDAKKSPADDFLMRDVAGATSAAPTYFSPKKIIDHHGTAYYEIDGGIFINRPVSLAVEEAYRQNTALSSKDIFLVSIGTGKVEFNLDTEALVNAGVISWLTKGRLIDLMIDSEGEYSEILANYAFPNHVRLQIDIPETLSAMDNCTPNNINSLLQLTEQYIHDHSNLINAVITKLFVGGGVDSLAKGTDLDHGDCLDTSVCHT